jgi:hypothetical protein
MSGVRRGVLLLAIVLAGGLLGVFVQVVAGVGQPDALSGDPVGPVLTPLASAPRAIRTLPPMPDPATEVPPPPAQSASSPTDPASTAAPAGDMDTVREPRGDPSRLVIQAIAVDVGLGRLGLAEDGTMEVPAFGTAGWYAEGPPPGRPGPAVIAAHVDSWEGPDVFFHLRALTVGDEVRVEFDSGDVARFIVEGLEQTPKDELPGDRIWPVTADVRLTLITCGGRFDRTIRSYDDNVIVYTRPAPG